MDDRRARSALEGKQLPPHFWENLKSLPHSPRGARGEQRLLEPVESVKTDKHTQSPLLKIFKDIMQREQNERNQEKEMSMRKDIEKRRLITERTMKVIEGKPSKCTEISKSFLLKPSKSEVLKDKQIRETPQKQQERRSSHSRVSEYTRDSERAPASDYHKSYVTSSDRKGSGATSGHSWKPTSQTVTMQEEQRPSQVRTDPVSIAPICLKKKMFWKKKEKGHELKPQYNRQYPDVANMIYDDRSEELRHRSHQSKSKMKNSGKNHGKKSRSRSEHEIASLEDECEILCETDGGEEGGSTSQGKGADMKENITLWQEGSPCWTNFVTELKKCQAFEKFGVTLSLMLLTVLIVGGVMYYYKVACAPRPLSYTPAYDFDEAVSRGRGGRGRQRVKKSDEYQGDMRRSSWDEDNIKTVDGVAGLSDYLGIRGLRELKSLANDDSPDGLKLQDFLKRLIETDNKIKQIKKNIMGVNLSKEDRFLKSNRYKRSIKWHRGPRLLYKKQKKEQIAEMDNDVEQIAKEVQEDAQKTQDKATEVTEQATTDADLTVIKETSTNLQHILTDTLKIKRKGKMQKETKRGKSRLHRDITDQNKLYNQHKNSSVAIIKPKKKISAYVPKRKVVKCTHVLKEPKSHEESLKHPYYKNTEHLDKFLDMLLDTNTSRVYDPHVNEIFKSKKTKCKHPTVIIGPVKLINDVMMKDDNINNILTRKEFGKLNKNYVNNAPSTSKHTQYKQNMDMLDTVSVTMTMQNFAPMSTKSASSKYNIFMSILTINPEENTAVTENLRSFSADRKFHNRRLMQVDEESEDVGLSYEDLKEVLSDDQTGHDETDRQVCNRKKRAETNYQNEHETANQHLLQLHVLKPLRSTSSGTLYNPNWKGPMPLYPDELNRLIKRPSKHINNIAIRNNDVPEENSEDESILSNVDYIEDYAMNSNGLAGKRAQAYSDYGVLTKDGNVVVASKNEPNSQDVATTKITDKLRYGKKSDSADILYENNIKQHYFGRIGRTLKSVREPETESLKKPQINSNKNVMFRSVPNSSIKIKQLRQYRLGKKYKYNKQKNIIENPIQVEDSKTISKITELPPGYNNLKIFETNNTIDEDKFTTELTNKFNTKTTEIIDTSKIVKNCTLLGSIFQKAKFSLTTRDDLNEQVEKLLDLSPDSNIELTKTTSPTTATTVTEAISDILNEIEVIRSFSKTSKKTTPIIVTTTTDFQYEEEIATEKESGKHEVFPTFTESYIVRETENHEPDVTQFTIVNNTKLTANERDLFSYLSKWLCAIVGAVSEVSTSTQETTYEEDSVESIEQRYRMRSLKAVDNHKFKSNIAENATASSVVDATTSRNNANATTTKNRNITYQHNELVKEKAATKQENRTLVKRNAADGSSFLYKTDIYDEDYEADLNPLEEPAPEKAKSKNKEFMKRQKEWIGRKMKKISNTLHVNPYKRMLKEKSTLEKDADDLMKFNDTRFRRNSVRYPRARHPSEVPVIDFNVLNSKMKEICQEAVEEVQQMRKVQGRADEPAAPTTSLLQQLTQLMSDLVDLQVQQKTCRKLPPDLQEFLVWLTAPEEQPRPPPQAARAGTGELVDGYMADMDPGDSVGDYGMAGLHDLETTVSNPMNTNMNYENLNPQFVTAMHAVQDLIGEYDGLTSDNKKKIAGVKDYLNSQLTFLRNQVDMNDLTSVYDLMRFKRDVTTQLTDVTEKTTINDGNRHKRKFVKNFSKKHTKTTANSIDDIQANTDKLVNDASGSPKKHKIQEIVTIAGPKNSNNVKFVETRLGVRDKRNLRDVYYRALSESNKHSTSTTMKKERQLETLGQNV